MGPPIAEATLSLGAIPGFEGPRRVTLTPMWGRTELPMWGCAQPMNARLQCSRNLAPINPLVGTRGDVEPDSLQSKVHYLG